MRANRCAVCATASQPAMCPLAAPPGPISFAPSENAASSPALPRVPLKPPACESAEQTIQQLVAVDAKVLGDVGENSGDRSGAQCAMPRDGDVVFVAGERRQPLVRAGLPGNDIAQAPESTGQLITGKSAW